MTISEYNICVDKYADDLYRFILKNIKDEERAKDIIQDTFEKIWLKLESVPFEKSRSYLFTTAYNRMIDVIRKNKFETSNDDLSNFKIVSHREQYSDLQEVLDGALDKLPEIQRSLILLRDYEGYSYKEIGEITDLTEAQVKVYIFRARKSLQNYLVSVETVLEA